MIQFWGYSAEEYEVLTQDGYYLTLNRIPGHKKGKEKKNYSPNPICVDLPRFGSVYIMCMYLYLCIPTGIHTKAHKRNKIKPLFKAKTLHKMMHLKHIIALAYSKRHT